MKSLFLIVYVAIYLNPSHNVNRSKNIYNQFNKPETFNYIKVLDYLNEDLGSFKKIYFDGILDSRRSFDAKKQIRFNFENSTIDTSGYYIVYSNDTIPLVKLNNLQKYNFSKKRKKDAYRLYIYPETKINNCYYFVRALITDGYKGTVYYFFIGVDTFVVESESYEV